MTILPLKRKNFGYDSRVEIANLEAKEREEWQFYTIYDCLQENLTNKHIPYPIKVKVRLKVKPTKSQIFVGANLAYLIQSLLYAQC